MIIFSSDMSIVFTNGCFDVIHYGHIKLFEHCRKLAGCGRVIVGINSDDSVRRLKGFERPIFSLEKRVSVLKALRDVDEIIPFIDDTPLSLIKTIRPDVIVKGGDYKPEEVVGYGFCKVEIFNFIDGFSTTGIIKSLSRG